MSEGIRESKEGEGQEFEETNEKSDEPIQEEIDADNQKGKEVQDILVTCQESPVEVTKSPSGK